MTDNADRSRKGRTRRGPRDERKVNHRRGPAHHDYKIDREELRRLRAEGLSYSQLAAHFGVNQASIGKALKRAEKRAMLKALIAKEATDGV